ncbi:protein with reverse transcriptase-like domain [Klebsormidium nitens]|uniref:Protein with reverse transcriptase-like domain n=1 Tax=Klebsormidium nitens TaxID=105231 RepID=A0A1Y1IM79_KLENI|nr:protein with reverse transcriptase-like domain [Klebsormidium nitens]|eukprot:GAQ91995.1 protein with reverse transcriptase-like domain [Klebsormidium nitens]
MAKPVEGGPDRVRPLAVGEVLRRLVARAVGLQYRERFREFFTPLQYGVATPGGCEAVVAGIWACLDLEPETLFLQVDLANAFNEVDRVAMFDELRLHFPELLPFFCCFYAEPSRLLLGRDSGDWELLQSSTGSWQGDPLAGFLFALAYHRPLSATCAAFPDVQLPSYADDTHIVGAPARAAEAFAHLQGGLATLSLRIDYAVLVRVFVLRPSYLMRTVSPSPEFLEQLRGYDRLLLGCFESLLGPDAFAGEAGELARRQNEEEEADEWSFLGGPPEVGEDKMTSLLPKRSFFILLFLILQNEEDEADERSILGGPLKNEENEDEEKHLEKGLPVFLAPS